MLVDTVTLTIKAGDGGNGAATFFRNARTAKGGPDGGNGGNGGNVYVQGSHNITDLREFRFKKKITALSGIPGKKWNLYGKNAPHITLYLPLGTQITDKEAGTTVEITDVTIPILLALGGKGGKGNIMFKSATNQTPLFAEKGTPGEKKTFLLELKLIADIGLIGLPNAGKSSLLAVLTHATPKIGDYPFTTLEPTIGIFEKHAIADIPGLIEGAAEGRGLGTTFLRHIEKTKILVHCIDVISPDIFTDYETIRKELEKHNPELIKKPEIILFTKIDLVNTEAVKKHTLFFQKNGKKVLAYSVYDPQSINRLKRELARLAEDESKRAKFLHNMLAPDFTLPDQNGSMNTLSQYIGKWVVLYFYPKDDTPGCTKEACGFRDNTKLLGQMGIIVLGVSKDSIATHKKFANKYQLPFPLLSDESKEAIQKYKAWGEKKFLGKTFEGILRKTYLINPRGEIQKIYEKVNPSTHIQEILKDLRLFIP